MVHLKFNDFIEFNSSKFLNDLKMEWNHQDINFPKQTHDIREWFIIIMEEIGEFANSILEFSKELGIFQLRKELIQCITLLIRIRYSIYTIESIDKKFRLII